MVRWSVLAAGAAVIAGAAFVTGASSPSAPDTPPVVPAKAEAAKTVVVNQKTGYFNMAKVMREYKRATSSVERLNARRERLSANVRGLRSMFLDLQVAHARSSDPARRAALESDLKTVAQRAEGMEREIQKLLQNQASMIIVEIHDAIRAATAELAREHGLVAVLAFPDATNPREAENPAVKELKLKPAAAHPFYLDPSVDYTDELIRRLNERLPADDK